MAAAAAAEKKKGKLLTRLRGKRKRILNHFSKWSLFVLLLIFSHVNRAAKIVAKNAN
jgi:hypothetical protein